MIGAGNQILGVCTALQMYRSREINPKLWPRIVHQAKHTPGNLRISFEIRQVPRLFRLVPGLHELG